MKNRLKSEAIFEDLRKLGIGFMLVGFIGLIIKEDVSAIGGGLLTSAGVIIWSIRIIKWSEE